MPRTVNGYSPSASRQGSGSLLKRLKKATTRVPSAPRPSQSPVAAGLAAQHLVASAVATARVVTKEKERRLPTSNQAHRLPLGTPTDTDPHTMRVPAMPKANKLVPIPPEERQILEWRHHAMFETGISARVGELY